MTSKLETVLAETWTEDDDYVMASGYVRGRFQPAPAGSANYAEVAILGKRALSYLLTRERDRVIRDLAEPCPECGEGPYRPHETECELGSIVAAAKEIG